MTHLNDALRLAQLGWKVFGLGPTGFPYPNCKQCRETCSVVDDYEKCDHLVCHATYAGTTDPARIEAMWAHFPQSLIGVRTGKASGIIVLDFDVHTTLKDGAAGYNMLLRNGWLYKTVSATTGGGGGHLYYRHPMNLSVPNDNRGKLGAGVDVKGEGGYVIAPPSAKRGKGAYSWLQSYSPWDRPLTDMPEPTLLAITKSDDKPVKFDGTWNVTVGDNSKVRRYWEAALELAQTTTHGSRNESLYVAACRGGEMIATEQLSEDEVVSLLQDAGRNNGLTESEIRQTIRSGLNRGANDFASEEAQ